MQRNQLRAVRPGFAAYNTGQCEGLPPRGPLPITNLPGGVLCLPPWGPGHLVAGSPWGHTSIFVVPLRLAAAAHPGASHSVPHASCLLPRALRPSWTRAGGKPAGAAGRTGLSPERTGGGASWGGKSAPPHTPSC